MAPRALAAPVSESQGRSNSFSKPRQRPLASGRVDRMTAADPGPDLLHSPGHAGRDGRFIGSTHVDRPLPVLDKASGRGRFRRDRPPGSTPAPLSSVRSFRAALVFRGIVACDARGFASIGPDGRPACRPWRSSGRSELRPPCGRGRPPTSRRTRRGRLPRSGLNAAELVAWRRALRYQPELFQRGCGR